MKNFIFLCGVIVIIIIIIFFFLGGGEGGAFILAFKSINI